jgi:hypothetical protein
MLRRRRQARRRAAAETPDTEPGGFDAVLTGELARPTPIQVDDGPVQPSSVAGVATLTRPVAAPSHLDIDLDPPTRQTTRRTRPPGTRGGGDNIDESSAPSTSRTSRADRAGGGTERGTVPDGDTAHPGDVSPADVNPSDVDLSDFDTELGTPPTLLQPDPGIEAAPSDFWARYDQARAAADLFAVPPAAAIAVVGPLEAAAVVARRIRGQLWDASAPVALLTDRARGASGADAGEHDPWTVVRRPDALVSALENPHGPAPLIIIDVPGELPSWIPALVERMREGGLGLVHYVLDWNPTDEDLATWLGGLGRPSVLDLAAPVEPERVLSLLDRGEPIASIAGVPLTAELLLALEIETKPGRGPAAG